MMWVYRKVKDANGNDLYCVGFYPPATGSGLAPCFQSIQESDSVEDARMLVNYLNGGTGDAF